MAIPYAAKKKGRDVLVSHWKQGYMEETCDHKNRCDDVISKANERYELLYGFFVSSCLSSL